MPCRLPTRHVPRSAVSVVALLALAACGADDPARVASEAPAAPGSAPDSATPTGPPPVTTTPPGAGRARLQLALQAARDRWQAASVDTYEFEYAEFEYAEFEYAVSCDCEPSSRTVRVLGGSAIGDVTGDALARATVHGWFEAVAEGIDTADAVEAEFDQYLGHPARNMIDPDDAVTGDEYGLDTVRFTIVRDPIERWFTEPWNCGFQLVASTPDQSAAVVLRLGDGPDDIADGSYAVDLLPVAEIRFGRDLMSNWCDDVLLPDEPVAAIADRWPITAGSIELARERGDTVVGLVDGLVASTPDGVVDIGGAALRNDAWGAQAG